MKTLVKRLKLLHHTDSHPTSFGQYNSLDEYGGLHTAFSTSAFLVIIIISVIVLFFATSNFSQNF